ncbi:hypothetical protein [Vandammella animalimorsus]|uniref:hypothetical protein n=1 Tax=Vandammella animalimorsus TaxID=2029117 RepID=UPI001177A9B2|nr:hypothetical protein [Vandammella animalimorsus]
MKKLFLSLLLFFLGGCSSVTKINYQGSALWHPMNFGSHYVLKKPVFLIEVFDEKKSYIALVPPNIKTGYHKSPKSIEEYLIDPKNINWSRVLDIGADKSDIMAYINRWHPNFPIEALRKLESSPLYDYFELLKDYSDPLFYFNSYYCCRAIGIANAGAVIVAHEAYVIDLFNPLTSPVTHKRYMRFAKYKKKEELVVNIDSMLIKNRFFEYFEKID